ncbi:IS701 family transposase [Actinacidiphila bryophytorum]|uniref:DDE_5 domain-containing protein n=1 Tax=Actinacidiphila bryophytorum TaxID=1436133 RepID=A0A9W4H3K6_9ACTN|nr:transposase [Actinacidiphila bryophytorum]MBM9439823.1 transposase [Actinacidiphila bryophytorum]MBN6543444.1 transposase [Actinacidiphila bryophytorum]CAG7648082.1 DDE_5 domain-containing protein [Actinacidiphila bryophytorum]
MADRQEIHASDRFPEIAALSSDPPPDLLESLFASLPRADQRRTGAEYVMGLLRTPGRKSARNIAHLMGGRGADQSLHHFVNQSTWAWHPVRRALAEYLVPRISVDAWVVRRTLIQKVGQHSVGVHRTFVPDAGRVLNAQQAVGVWAASAEGSGPVDWELRLPRGWLDDDLRRRRASIPDSAFPETYAEQVARQCRTVVQGWGLPVRPVVLDAREMDLATVLGRLGRADIPVLARIDASVPLTVADPALTGHPVSARMTAGEAVRAAQGTACPARWRGPGAPGGVRAGQLTGVAVKAADGGAGDHLAEPRILTLMGLAERGRPEAQQLWLTDIPTAHPASLLRLCTLLERVEYDYAATAKSVGIEDYAGRSFCGWHRHMTLASVAHAVALPPAALAPAAHGDLVLGGALDGGHAAAGRT